MGVREEHRGPVALVTLDWPERRNSLHPTDLRDVAALIEDQTTEQTAVIVITGNGAFCSGGDLGGLAERTSMSESSHRRQISSSAHRLIRALVGAPMPILAAIDGPAIGLGFDIALACDDRLVGPNGWCMQGWGRVGVIPGAGGVLLLRLLNPSLLWRLLATQPRIGGDEMERWGLGESVSDGSALDVAIERATALSEQPRDVLELYVSLSRATLRRELPEHLDLCARAQARLLADPALAARIEKLRSQL